MIPYYFKIWYLITCSGGILINIIARKNYHHDTIEDYSQYCCKINSLSNSQRFTYPMIFPGRSVIVILCGCCSCDCCCVSGWNCYASTTTWIVRIIAGSSTTVACTINHCVITTKVIICAIAVRSSTNSTTVWTY